MCRREELVRNSAGFDIPRQPNMFGHPETAERTMENFRVFPLLHCFSKGDSFSLPRHAIQN